MLSRATRQVLSFENDGKKGIYRNLPEYQPQPLRIAVIAGPRYQE